MNLNFTPDTFDFTGYRMPAEWTPQDAVWLAWPKNIETWPDDIEGARTAFESIIKALCEFQSVMLLVDEDSEADAVERQLRSCIPNLKNLQLCRIPYDDSWMRDAGPIFITQPGADIPLVAHDFVFNAWGGKYEPWRNDDAIPQHIAHKLDIPRITHDFVLEGGSIDVNGEGTLLTTRQCLLNPNRNPNLSQEQIEARLKEWVGVERVLWLDQGIEGDDTDGHIDDIARFVSPHRVLAMMENNRSDPNYETLRSNRSKLRAMSDQDGNKLEVVDLPMPNLDLRGPFGRSPASYANFSIANGCVLVPVFSAPNQDSVLSIFRDLFPDRRVIPVECAALVKGLGAIHCVTQQQPRVESLSPT